MQVHACSSLLSHRDEYTIFRHTGVSYHGRQAGQVALDQKLLNRWTCAKTEQNERLTHLENYYDISILRHTEVSYRGRHAAHDQSYWTGGQ